MQVSENCTEYTIPYVVRTIYLIYLTWGGCELDLDVLFYS